MNFDVVDILLAQHDEIRRQCAGIERSRGEERTRQFAELCRALRLHEHGEQAVVHPATRSATAAGEMVGVARLREEGAIEQSLVELHELGTRHPGFDDRFTDLHRAVLEHLTREELDEFPLLRLYVPVQRLHWMVGELHDVHVLHAA
jgi:hypothetical protein